MISVVIPAYNRAHTLSNALQSVLAQSYQDFEIIIVDDASTDGTISLLKQYADPRIRSLAHSTNQGAGAARNTGIKQAKGEWIAFLDSDDEWTEKKLERQFHFLSTQTAQDEDVLVSCTGYSLNLLDDNKQLLRTLEHHRDINESIYYGCDISPGSTMMVKRSVFEKVGYFAVNLKRLEDWEWLLRYRNFGKIALLQEPLAIINNKRGREGEALEKSIPQFIANYLSTVNKLSFFRKRELFANIWLQAVGTYQREKKFFKTLLSLSRALYWDPTILLKYILRL